MIIKRSGKQTKHSCDTFLACFLRSFAVSGIKIHDNPNASCPFSNYSLKKKKVFLSPSIKISETS